MFKGFRRCKVFMLTVVFLMASCLFLPCENIQQKVLANNNQNRYRHGQGQQKEPVIEVHMYNGTRNGTSNQVSPYLRIYNVGNKNEQLKDITLRYYFTIDVERDMNFYCDWAGKSKTGPQIEHITPRVNGSFVRMDPFMDNADHYLEISFDNGTGVLHPGEYVELHTRFARDDWSEFNQFNDYSFKHSGSYFDLWESVTAYIDGELVFGNEPSDDMVPYPEDVDIKVQTYNTDKSEFTNTIRPYIRIVNTGENPIDLEDITVRYYFTVNGERPQQYHCDYAAIDGWHRVPSSKVNGTFGEVSPATDTCDYYLEIGFDAGAGSIGAGGSVLLQGRFNKDNWTNYNQYDDYSFNRFSNNYEDWEYVTGYVNDYHLWGIEPFSPTINLTSPENGIHISPGTEVTISAEGVNCHHIAAAILDSEGNVEWLRTQEGNSYSYDYTFNEPGIYEVYAAVRNTSDEEDEGTVRLESERSTVYVETVNLFFGDIIYRIQSEEMVDGTEDEQEYNRFAVGEYIPLKLDFRLMVDISNPVIAFDYNLMDGDTGEEASGFVAEKIKNGDNFYVKMYNKNDELLGNIDLVEDPDNPDMLKFRITGECTKDSVFKIRCMVKVSASEALLQKGLSADDFGNTSRLYFMIDSWEDSEGTVMGPSDSFYVNVIVEESNTMR